MEISITKAVIDGNVIPCSEINFKEVLTNFSTKVNQLVIDEKKKAELPLYLKQLFQQLGGKVHFLGGSEKKIYDINSYEDIRTYLFEQYAFYHHTENPTATFKIDEDNYIEMMFS